MATDIIARGMAASTAAALPGKANLVNGKVPLAELPSYVDDVVEYPTVADFPAEGERGKIYVATSTNETYRWSGSEYIMIGFSCPSTTDGAYILRATVTSGVVSYEWIPDTTVKTTEA